jgi:hypothetical protein
MLVLLKVKLADVVNGLDLSHCSEGDVIEVAERDGALLIAEHWAEHVSGQEAASRGRARIERDVAADAGVRAGRKGSRRRRHEKDGA